MTRVDVIIQGAGIVGSTLALLLTNALPECKILLLDHAPLVGEVVGEVIAEAVTESVSTKPDTIKNLGQWTPRVSALSLASQAILTAIDAWPSAARLAPYQRMRVTPFTATAELVLEASDMSAPYLGVIVENQGLLQALHRRVRAQSRIQVLTGVSLDAVQQSAQWVQVQLGEAVYQAQLLVAADGANSRIAELVVFAQQRIDYQHSALITHLHTSHHHDWQAQQIFLENGPLAFLPLTTRCLFTPGLAAQGNIVPCPPAGNAEQYVSLVWSGPNAQQQALMLLSDAQFLAELNRLIPANLGAALSCQARATFPLVRQSVKTVVQHRVVLVGDAAQRMHPLAGQGLNIGLLDAAVLVAHMSKSGDFGNSDLGNTQSLQGYQQARQAQKQLLTAVIHQLYRHYRPQTPWWMQLVRQQGFEWAAQSSLFKMLMSHMANAQSLLPENYQPYWPSGCQ